MYLSTHNAFNISFPPSTLSSSQKDQPNMKVSFVCFLLLFLGFMISTTSSRSFGRMRNEVALQELHFQEKLDMAAYEENREFDESTTRRMALENEDYGGTGANDRHDPKSPGRP